MICESPRHWPEEADPPSTLDGNRRIQLLLTMPFVLLAGVIWGWFSAPAIGEGSRLFWSLMGAAGFGLLFYLEQRLLPLVAAIADRIGVGALAALAWEVGVVGGLIFLFTSVLGAPVVPAVALAFGTGMLYSLGMEYVVFGSGAEHMTNLWGLRGGWSGPRGPGLLPRRSVGETRRPRGCGGYLHRGHLDEPEGSAGLPSTG